VADNAPEPTWADKARALHAEGVAGFLEIARIVGASEDEVRLAVNPADAVGLHVAGLRADLAHYARIAIKAEQANPPDVKTALRARQKASELRREIRDALGAYDPNAPRAKIAAAQAPPA